MLMCTKSSAWFLVPSLPCSYVLCKYCASKVVHEPKQSGHEEFLSSSNMPGIQDLAFPPHCNFNLQVQISWLPWHEFLHSYLLDKAFPTKDLLNNSHFVEAALPLLGVELPLPGSSTCTVSPKPPHSHSCLVSLSALHC